MKRLIFAILVMAFLSSNVYAAEYTLTITVPDDKISELTDMIDARLATAYGKNRTDEGMTYVEWMEFLIKEYLKSNYKAWKKEQIVNANPVTPGDVIQ